MGRCWLLVGQARNCTDPATGVWTPTGSLSIYRILHTATLLPNGKVLVAGGFGGAFSLTSAELYDPATGVWTATGSMNIGRDSHTATLLPNGQVLVAGGFDNHGSVTAELYDPATGLWTETDSLNTGRALYTATLLPNGQVLAAGGDAAGASAELYDPASGVWTADRQHGQCTLESHGDVAAQWAGVGDWRQF